MKTKRSLAGSRSLFFLFFAVPLMTALTVSCATTGGAVKDEMDWQASELCKGVKAYARGYTQFHKVVIEMEMGNPDQAAKHLKKSIDDFDKAVLHFQNAEGTKEEAEAVQRISEKIAKGNAELRKADACFDKGDQGKAGIHCGAAVRDFMDAVDMMDEQP